MSQIQPVRQFLTLPHNNQFLELFTLSFSSFPGLKWGIDLGAMTTALPVLGISVILVFLFVKNKLLISRAISGLKLEVTLKDQRLTLQVMAKRGGFEPPIRLQTVYSLSRGAPSATRPPLRKIKPSNIYSEDKRIYLESVLYLICSLNQ